MRRLYLIVVAAAVFAISCKKHTENISKYTPPNGSLIASVKLYEDTTFVKETFYEYDQFNRPLRTYTSDSDFTFYYYNDNKITEQSHFKYGNTAEYVYDLKYGLANSYTFGNGNGTYQYNSFGQLTFSYEFVLTHTYDTSRYVYDNNGNCVFHSYTTSYNINTYNTYTFTDTLNTIGRENMGITWRGADNKLLMASDEYIAYFGPSPDTTTSYYRYELNSDRSVYKRHFSKVSKTSVKNYTEIYSYMK